MSMNRRKLLTLLGAGAVSVAALGALDARVSAASPNRAEPSTGGQPPAPGGTTATTSAPAATGGPGGSALVVFFSRKGENYPNLNLEVGNTARVGQFIHERVGGDLFEIVPAVEYPARYSDMTRLAQQEADDNAFPAIAGSLPTGRYSTVFLGHPIWWSEPPRIVHTFMRAFSVGDTPVIPFVTHAGSGWANSLSAIGRYYPQVRRDGFLRSGVDVYRNPDGTRQAVNSWLGGLGY